MAKIEQTKLPDFAKPQKSKIDIEFEKSKPKTDEEIKKQTDRIKKMREDWNKKHLNETS